MRFFSPLLPLRNSGPFALAALLLAGLVACGGGSTDSTGDAVSSSDGAESTEASVLTVYSGRNESLVQPILDRFAETSGVEVKVRYGGTAELAATLMEESDSTPADVFIGQDVAALGALAREGLFEPLPQEILDRVPARFHAPDGRWIGLSGRARVVVYNPMTISVDELPKSLEAVAEPRYAGRFGIAPVNGSFQAHMAVYRQVEGAEALNSLLAGFAGNSPQIYPKNSAIVEAVLSGEIDFGLVNHYYLLRALAENPSAPGANYTMTEGQAASFVNLAGIGVIDLDSPAVRLVDFLTSQEAQAYFANTTYEYPVIAAVPANERLTPVEELPSPDVDFGTVAEGFEATLEAIAASNLMP